MSAQIITPFTMDDYESIHNKLTDSRELVLKMKPSREGKMVLDHLDTALLWYATIQPPVEQ